MTELRRVIGASLLSMGILMTPRFVGLEYYLNTKALVSCAVEYAGDSLGYSKCVESGENLNQTGSNLLNIILEPGCYSLMAVGAYLLATKKREEEPVVEKKEPTVK